MFEKSAFSTIKSKLIAARFQRDSSRVLVGFDGYIDKLVRLPNESGYFESISDFIAHISRYRNQSSDMRIERISEKLGGNCPLLAEALAAKDVPVTCIGAMGEPELHRQFAGLAKTCETISVEQPAECFSIEFTDGKLMFGDTGSLDRITFRSLCAKVGEERLAALLDKCDLFCFTNWSGLLNSNELLSGILNDICPRLRVKPRSLFLDLADPTAQEEEKFTRFFELIGALRRYFTVIVGLNPKEFLQTYNRFFKRASTEITPDMPAELSAEFPADEFVLHGLDFAVAGDRSHEIRKVQSELVREPRVVTGGGDNFNAGYCVGKLLSLSPAECALIGNLSGMLYVRDGFPATIQRMIDFISNIERG